MYAPIDSQRARPVSVRLFPHRTAVAKYGPVIVYAIAKTSFR